MGKNKEVIKLDLNGNEICRYFNAREAWEANHISKDRMRKAIGTDKVLEGFKYIYSGQFSDEVDKSGWRFKCPYCTEVFETYNGLCKHVLRFKKHGEISQEQLLADFSYKGERPKCKCGCGEYTDISYEGGAHFCDYKLGHASRIHNNWGHNDQAIKNSIKTRKDQYKSGERIQWNKGTKWVETYSEEKVKELSDILHSEERGRKISEKLKGVPKSEEHVRKIIARMESGEFKIDSTGENNFIENFIKPLEIAYKRQYYIKEIRQFVDIYIPSKNIFIEYDGDFWHCNPQKYPNGPIYECQYKKVAKDIEKAKWCEKNNILLLRFWESDVLTNVEDVVKKLRKYILGD